MSFRRITQSLAAHASKQKALRSASFFKTHPGGYSEGDVFIGVTVPEQRAIAKQFADAPLSVIKQLLASPVHEHRLTGLIIATEQFENASDAQTRKKLFLFFLKNIKRVNNWDLVDATAPVFGTYLVGGDTGLLKKLAQSKNMWERRIAMVMTHAFIKKGMVRETFSIAELLLADTHDLIHKVSGWMLREAGIKNRSALEAFLKKHHKTMPRTMLRYSIEHFPESKRKRYLAGIF